MDLQTIIRPYDFAGQTIVVTGGAGVLASEMVCARVLPHGEEPLLAH